MHIISHNLNYFEDEYMPVLESSEREGQPTNRAVQSTVVCPISALGDKSQGCMVEWIQLRKSGLGCKPIHCITIIKLGKEKSRDQTLS